MNKMSITTHILLVLIILILASCMKGEDPSWDNPLDPNNPLTNGDPYKLEISIQNGGISLEWNRVQIDNLKGYNIYRSVDNSNFTLIRLEINSVEFTDENIENGKTYKYYVVAVTESGEADTSAIEALTINTSPILSIDSEFGEYTPYRNVSLTIIANDATNILLSNHPNFNTAEWEGFYSSMNWQLDLGAGIKTVYMKIAYANGDTSEVVDASIEASHIVPALTIINPADVVNDVNIQLSMPETGALEMLVSNSDDSTGINWQTYSDTLDWQLENSDGWQEINVWFRNDFFATEPVHDVIGLDRVCGIESLEWTSTSDDTLRPGDTLKVSMQAITTPIGDETSGIAILQLEGYPDIFSLAETTPGLYEIRIPISANYPLLPNTSITATLTDSLGNISSPYSSEQNLDVRGYLPGELKTFILGSSDQTIEMAWIPRGSFLMGSDNSDSDLETDELPVHEVVFNSGFWMSSKEITQSVYTSIVGSNPSRFTGDNRPVENISYLDAIGFIQLFNRDHLWKLPSEAEWEYACRAGSTGRFHWGDDTEYTEIDAYAWTSSNSQSEAHVTGDLGPNPYNLYDMHGNVWEWCEDWYHVDYDGAPSNGSAWLIPESNQRILRGGSWFTSGTEARSANRMSAEPTFTYSFTGFRIVKRESN